MEAENVKRKLERDNENENGGAGVYSASLKKHYLLADDEWKEDNMPEILDGHNVYDFIDQDIVQRLEELEKEEGLLQEQGDGEDEETEGEDLTPEQQKELNEIMKNKIILIREHRIKKSITESRPIVHRKFDKDKRFTSERMGRQLSSLGLDPSKARKRVRSESRGRKRERSSDHGDGMDVDADEGSNKKMKIRSKSRSMLRARSMSRPPVHELVPGKGYKDSAQKVKAFKMGKSSVHKRNKAAKKGEGDRVIPTLKLKHLFSRKWLQKVLLLKKRRYDKIKVSLICGDTKVIALDVQSVHNAVYTMESRLSRVELKQGNPSSSSRPALELPQRVNF
ncbi:unnamed protein product [Lactuca virosa]|uniref:NOG C-terminal domain-containing protein n=1 Tax=Lactuca virosa TaxID=75947 RepID=A0AAU9M9A2_9ASTR|nr:unnamed protein product [Lactuca virosa]